MEGGATAGPTGVGAIWRHQVAPGDTQWRHYGTAWRHAVPRSATSDTGRHIEGTSLAPFDATWHH